MNSNEKIIPKNENIKNIESDNELGDNSIFFGEPVDEEKKIEDREELNRKIASLLESIKNSLK